VIALVLAAFAASAETSLTSISRVRLRHLCEEGNPRAIKIDNLHKDPNGYLSTILIINTVAIIVASSAATLLALHLHPDRVTEEELKMLVEVGEEEGVLEEREREMIHGIFEMGDMRVREIMVPRTDLVAIDVSRPVQEAVDLVVKHGHTRIPLYDGSIDNIVGVLYAKDLLKAVVHGNPGSRREIARKPYVTPECNKVQDVLRDLRKNRVHMAIVVDEYGGTAGAVTIEDIIEEIVGPIQDEY